MKIRIIFYFVQKKVPEPLQIPFVGNVMTPAFTISMGSRHGSGLGSRFMRNRQIIGVLAGYKVQEVLELLVGSEWFGDDIVDINGPVQRPVNASDAYVDASNTGNLFFRCTVRARDRLHVRLHLLSHY